MQAFDSISELIGARDLKGPVDLYSALLTIKNGFVSGGKLGCYAITKANAKKAGIDWQFVEDSCSILGLKLTKNNGPTGHVITK